MYQRVVKGPKKVKVRSERATVKEPRGISQKCPG